MANTDATGSGGDLPGTEDEIVAAIRDLDPLPANSTLQFWRIGEELDRLPSRGGGIPTATLSKGSGISERELRYCVKVHQAFTYDRLKSLVGQGMRWSSVRELAGDMLTESDRDELIRDFESKRLTNAQLLAEAIARRKRRTEGKTEDADGGGREARVKRATERVVSQSTRLRRELTAARRVLGNVAAGAPTDHEGALKPATVKRVRAMRDALQGLLTEIEGLLQQSSGLGGEKHVSAPGSD